VNRVLVIEDNTVAGPALRDFLTAHGYRTVWATNMAAAEAQAARFRPEAIVLDLNLSAGTPLEALDRARAMPGGGHIMVLTALPKDQVPPLRRTSVLIQKPADPEEILRRLELAMVEGA
jgi:DNA-binding response OmpR family regulator